MTIFDMPWVFSAPISQLEPRTGRTIVIVEQNAYAALSVAHHGYMLENGRVAQPTSWSPTTTSARPIWAPEHPGGWRLLGFADNPY